MLRPRHVNVQYLGVRQARLAHGLEENITVARSSAAFARRIRRCQVGPIGYGTYTHQRRNHGWYQVREVMTGNPRCVTPETPVSEAARLMKSEDVGSLPILEGKKVTSVITDRDIVIRQSQRRKTRAGCRYARLRVVNSSRSVLTRISRGS